MKRLLIVEDEKDMQEIYRDMFSDKSEKYEIDIVSDAAVGLRKIKEKAFDLIILDIIMEPMTGDSFFVYVRDDVKTMNLPVIVVSVLNPDTLENLKKINHVHFFQKPLKKEQLMKKIEEILS